MKETFGPQKKCIFVYSAEKRGRISSARLPGMLGVSSRLY